VHYPVTFCSGKTMNGSFCKTNREGFDRYSFGFYSALWTQPRYVRIDIVSQRILVALVCYFALFLGNASFIYDENYLIRHVGIPPRQ
jgi:hypothetical protein